MKLSRAMTSVAATAALLLAAGCGDNGEGSDDDAYVIGWINPLSGASAFFGEASRDAVLLALADINGNGGINGRELVVRFEDNELRPDASITAFQRLMADDPVTVLTAGSSVVIALAPLAEQNGIMLGNIGAQSPELISPKYPNVYNFIPTSAAEAERLAERMYHGEGIGTVSMIFVDNDYGIDTAAAFKEAYEQLGGQVLAQERHDLGTSDMRTQLIQINNAGADALVVASNVTEVGHAVAQAREVGITEPLYGFTYALSPDNFTIASDEMEGMRGVAVSFDGSEGAAGAEFAQRYEQEYGVFPTVFAAVAYDAVHIIATGLAEVGDDPAALLEYVANVTGFDGVLGPTTMSPDRQSLFPLNEWEYRNGAVVSWD